MIFHVVLRLFTGYACKMHMDHNFEFRTKCVGFGIESTMIICICGKTVIRIEKQGSYIIWM